MGTPLDSHSLSPPSIFILLLFLLSSSSVLAGPMSSSSSSPYSSDSAKEDCCLINDASELVSQSRVELDNLIGVAVENVSDILEARRVKFDEFFQEIMRRSRFLLDQMYVETYGVLYEQNSYIFTDMLDKLLQYYKSGGIDLTQTLDEFFQKLYKKMFQVLNSQYHFKPKYLDCVGRRMNELKPFGDVPNKLVLEVKRSFIAARTFVQGLAAGNDVVKEVKEFGSTSECSRSLALLRHCPLNCDKMNGRQPCLSHCTQVLKSCLRRHLQLDMEWNNYIDAILRLATRLETSFNTESVVIPINVKISEAIMNFQENGKLVSDKLFEFCGKPNIGKRSTNLRLNLSPSLSGRRMGMERGGHSIDAAGSNMKRLIKDVRQQIKLTKGYWAHLPARLCTEHRSFSKSNSHNCWNGTGIIDGGRARYNDNNNLDLDFTKENIIKQQMMTLKLITTRLIHAYNGVDVYWKNNFHRLNVGTISLPSFSNHEFNNDKNRNRHRNNWGNSFGVTRNPTSFKVNGEEDYDQYEGSGGSGDGPLFEDDNEDGDVEENPEENLLPNHNIHFSQPSTIRPPYLPEKDLTSNNNDDNALNPLGILNSRKVEDATDTAGIRSPNPLLIFLLPFFIIIFSYKDHHVHPFL